MSVDFEEDNKYYEFSEADVARMADRSAGHYSNKLIARWLDTVGADGSLVVDVSRCGNVVQRACYIRALQEIKNVNGFSVTRENDNLFEIRKQSSGE